MRELGENPIDYELLAMTDEFNKDKDEEIRKKSSLTS
jgi:hypothetical protein